MVYTCQSIVCNNAHWFFTSHFLSNFRQFDFWIVDLDSFTKWRMHHLKQNVVKEFKHDLLWKQLKSDWLALIFDSFVSLNAPYSSLWLMYGISSKWYQTLTVLLILKKKKNNLKKCFLFKKSILSNPFQGSNYSFQICIHDLVCFGWKLENPAPAATDIGCPGTLSPQSSSYILLCTIPLFTESW